MICQICSRVKNRYQVVTNTNDNRIIKKKDGMGSEDGNRFLPHGIFQCRWVWCGDC